MYTAKSHKSLRYQKHQISLELGQGGKDLNLKKIDKSCLEKHLA